MHLLSGVTQPVNYMPNLVKKTIRDECVYLQAQHHSGETMS